MAYIYSKSEPAVEKSTNISFAPYMLKLPGLNDLFTKSNLDFYENHWSEIYQFGYMRELDNQQWSIANPKACKWAESYYTQEGAQPIPE